MHARLLLLLLFATSFISGCDDTTNDAAKAPPANVSSNPAPLKAAQPLLINAVELEAEIALNVSEQSLGLMYRESMPENHGMLFVYEQPQQMGFWMKNTLIPLDIGFFDAEGRLKEVIRMYPKDLTSKQSRSDQIQFALEMNQGWFARNKLAPGAQLDLNTLRQAIAARGVDPTEYGL
jgi:hypothetical protein